jgi:crotonobetainyl-CoA:carnitine CoA-transferase CaiB-like acyl-CoA transferase
MERLVVQNHQTAPDPYRGERPGTQTRPLRGTLVVEFGQFIAAPGAAALLGDLGASVVKVEPPAGDSMRASNPVQFNVYNKAKRSLSVNIKDQRGLDIARDLALSADVVIQNLRPGAMERLGLGPRELRQAKPSLIYGSVTGYGEHGPWAGQPGFDIAAQAKSGMMSINGQPGGPPTRVGFTVVDGAASHFMAQAVLSALFGRERHGTGSTVTISLLDVALHLQAPVFATYFRTGQEPIPYGDGQQIGISPAGIFKTADGSVVLAAYLPKHWENFSTAIGRPDLVSDPRFATNELRVHNRGHLMEEIQPYFSANSMRRVVETLSKANVVVAPVNRYSDVIRDDDVTAGEALGRMVADDGTDLTIITNPIRCSDWGDRPVESAPRLGEHTEEVLRDLGYPSAAIREMLDDKVIHCASEALVDAPGGGS